MSRGAGQDHRVKNEAAILATETDPIHTSRTGQLELVLAPEIRPRPVLPGPVRRPRRTAVARWWFARMRETVRTVEAWAGPGVPPAGADHQVSLALSPTPARYSPREGAWVGLGFGAAARG